MLFFEVMMTAKLSYAIVAGGVLLGLSGCSSSGGGLSDSATRSATATITPNKTQTTTPNRNSSQGNNQTTPSRNTNQNNTQATTNNNQNTNPNRTNTNSLAVSALSTSNFGFSVPVADKQPLNKTFVTNPPPELAQEVQKVLDGTNRLRAEKGLKPLKLDPNLTAYAQVRASEIAIQYNHKRLDGSSIGGFGENIYSSPKNAQEAIEGWRKSEGHYNNMTSSNYDSIGIGVVYDPNSQWKYHWVQLFAFKGVTAPYDFANANNNNPEPLQQVVIDGKNIPLTLNKTGEWQQITTNGNQGWVNGYQHTRFGVVTPQGATASHLYYQGQRTSDVAIPKSGTATYNGTALVVKDGKVNPNVQSKFTANFGTRKLNGTLTQNNTTLYNLSADINGGAFASKADAPVQTQGAFFGQNAEELAGVFKDTKTNTKGAFGAKQ